jgi:NAD(P)-dependent dehydrogenase (short-subunit alcohol dehydrogenase family)
MSDTAPRPGRWLVTGVSSGLGRSIAQAALRRGHKVVGTLRNEAQFADFEALAPGRAFALKLDVTDDASVEAGVAGAVERLGGLDVLVNNAGYALMGPSEDVSVEEARRQMDANFLGVFRMTHAVLPVFKAQGAGRIINIASVAAVLGFQMNTLYSASKHAVAGFSEGLAKEVARHGIKVTSVEPGGFRTKFGTGSLKTPAEVSADNAAAVETLKARMTAFAGNAVNDPDKGGEVIADLAELDEPPVHLALGADGYSMITGALKARLEEYERFRELGSATAYEG